MLLARWLRLVSKNCYRLFHRLLFLSAPSSPFFNARWKLFSYNLPKLYSPNCGPLHAFPKPRLSYFLIFLGWARVCWPLLCLCRHFVYLRYVWIQSQRAAVASNHLPTNLATHLPTSATLYLMIQQLQHTSVVKETWQYDWLECLLVTVQPFFHHYFASAIVGSALGREYVWETGRSAGACYDTAVSRRSTPRTVGGGVSPLLPIECSFR